MTGGRDEQDGRALRSGRAGRPRWMTLLTILMLLIGGRLFFGSVTDLHRVVTGKAEILTLDGTFDAQQEALLRAQVVLANALSSTRPAALTVHALARLALGLLYLFAVAAVFSRDARGRRVSVLAGWAGVAVSGINAIFLAMVVRGMLPRLLPVLADAFAKDAARAGRPAPSADVVAVQARLFLVDVPLVVTGIGAVFSLALVLYFGGRRVRLFYNQHKQADHG
jgi:hypothetical protein